MRDTYPISDFSRYFSGTVLDAYFTIGESARWEMANRLLEFSHQRYEEEVLAGLHEKQGNRGGKRKSRKELGGSKKSRNKSNEN